MVISLVTQAEERPPATISFAETASRPTEEDVDTQSYLSEVLDPERDVAGLRASLQTTGKSMYDYQDRMELEGTRDFLVMEGITKDNIGYYSDMLQYSSAQIPEMKYPSAALVGMRTKGVAGTSDDMFEYLNADRWNRALDRVSSEFNEQDGTAGSLVDFATSMFSPYANVLAGNWYWDNKGINDIWKKSLDPDYTDDQLVSDLGQWFEEEVDKSDPLSNRNWFYFNDAMDVARDKGLGDTVTTGMLLNGITSLFGVPGGAWGLKATTGLVRGGSAAVASVTGRKTFHNWLTSRMVSGQATPNMVYNTVPTAGKFPMAVSGPIDFEIATAGVQAGRNASTQYQLAQWLRSMPFRNVIDPDNLTKNYAKIADKFFKDVLPKRAVGSRLINTGVVNTERYGVAATQEGNLIGWAMVGNGAGRPFKLVNENLVAPGNFSRVEGTTDVIEMTGSLKQALERAGPDARLVQTAADEAVIVRSFTLKADDFGEDLIDVFKTQDQHTLFKGNIGSLANFLGSSAGRLDKKTVAAFLESEAVQGRVTNQLKDQIRSVFGTLDKHSLDNMSNLLKAITDGELSHMSRHLTDAELNLAYSQKFGRPATQAEVDAYRFFTELDDTVWAIEADRVMKELVDQGFDRTYRIVPSNPKQTTQRVVVRGADDLPKDKYAIDASTGRPVKVENIKNGKGNFFETTNETRFRYGDDQYQTIWVPSSMVGRSNAISHSDVIGFRPGFSRRYVGDNAFVKQDNVVKTGGSTTRAGKPTTLGYANTAQIAEQSAIQINNILKRIRLGIPDPANMTKKQIVDNLKQSSALFKRTITNTLLRNNSWADDIDDFDGLIEWIEREGVDITKDVTVALKGETIKVADPADPTKFINFGGSWGDPSIRNATGTQARSAKLLRNMSGETSETLGGFEGMFASVQKSLHYKSWQAAIESEAKRWWETARGLVKDPSDLEKLPPLQRLRSAEINVAAGDNAARLEQARKDILRTFGMEDKWGDSWFDSLGNSLANIVLGSKAGDKLSKVPFVNVTDARLAEGVRRVAGKLPDELRKLAFNLKLGFYNPVQLVVQASQVAQIAVLEPARMMRATPMAVALRAYRAAGPAARREIAEATWKAAGLKDADEMVDFFKMMEDSGRLDVGGSIADKGGMIDGPKLDAPSAWATVRNNHRMFFEEGERWPRMVAGAVSYLKQMDNVGANRAARNSRAFRDAWWNEQDNLTFNMTSALSAPWQRSNLSVTFQFMTYMTRSVEMLLRKNGLSSAQRARLLAGNILLYGGTGVGVGGWLDENRASSGWASGLDDDTFELLRMGAIGALTNSIGLGDISPRLAPAQGLLDWYTNISEKSYVEVVSGPGGAIIKDLAADSWELGVNLYSYEGVTTKQDLAKFASTISTGSTALKIFYAMRYGEYFNRNGDLIADGLDMPDAVGILMGATPKEVSIAYRTVSAQKAMKEGAIEAGKLIGKLMDRYGDAKEAGDEDLATNIRDQIFTAMAPLSPWERKKGETYWKKRYESLFDSAMVRQMDIGSQIWQQHSE